MAIWKEILASGEDVTLLSNSPNSRKVVAQSSVSTQLAAIVENALSVLKNSELSNNVKELNISSRLKFKYEDVNGVSAVGNTYELDAKKLEDLVDAIQNAPRK